jgi:hypothetical protein
LVTVLEITKVRCSLGLFLSRAFTSPTQYRSNPLLDFQRIDSLYQFAESFRVLLRQRIGLTLPSLPALLRFSTSLHPPPFNRTKARSKEIGGMHVGDEPKPAGFIYLFRIICCPWLSGLAF